MKQVGPIRMSRDRPTQLDCLRELQTRIQQDHGPKYVTAAQAWQSVSSPVASTKRPVDEGDTSSNANEVLMLQAKLKTLEERSVIVNKSMLETEKERDKLHKELELIEVQLQGKRACTHDDTGDGHDMHAEVGHSVVGARRARVFEGEELDPSRVDQISWCQVVRVRNRPLGQRTSSQSHHQ
jgi:hypothetical protein